MVNFAHGLLRKFQHAMVIVPTYSDDKLYAQKVLQEF